MGNFSLDKYQTMKPLFVEALDASRTVDILNHAQKEAALSANIKKTPAVEGVDVNNRDAIHDQYGNIINQAADAEGNPLDKASYVRKLGAEYVNNPLLEAYGKSDAQRNDYNSALVDRVKKADIKAEDADLASQAALLKHNYKGGTNPQTGNFFANSLYNVPNVVDEQEIAAKIKTPGSGYTTENQSYSYDPTTGNVRVRDTKTGIEQWWKGDEVGSYLYSSNQEGIRDRHIWDAKKEVARQLVNDGKYKTEAEAFVAVDHNANGDFTNRLNERINEKRSRFINNLSAQNNFDRRQDSDKYNIDLGPNGGAGLQPKEPTELVIDTRSDVHTLSISDEDLDKLDLDKFLNENQLDAGKIKDVTKALAISPMLGGGYSYTSGSDAEKSKKAQADYIEVVKTIKDLKEGNSVALKKYGINPEQWKTLPKEDQYNKIKALIKQRKNTTSSVGILEANNTNVYKGALDNASEIFVFDHNKNNYEKVDRKDFKSKYLDNSGWFSSSLSEQDMKQLKQNSGFKSNNDSASIDSYEEYTGHAASKTPVLAFDFTGYKVKPYLQFNAGDNNSSVRVPISDITESSLVPIQNAFKEFKNPTGNEVKIAPHIELSSGGQYKEYNNLTARWVDGTYTIFAEGKPTSLTLEKLAVGMVGRQINNLNTTANTVKVKSNKPEGGQ